MKRCNYLGVLCLGLAASTLSNAQALGGSFWDGFDTNTFNPSIWEVSNYKNGDPFGCAFEPSMVKSGTGGHLNLTLNSGNCSQIETYAQYLNGTLQTQLQYSNVPGTVASLFTYNSYYTHPGDPWQEIDIEFLPSKPDMLHTNVIFQASATSANVQYEKYVSLSSYNINPVNGPVQVGFDWSPTQISWFIYDSAGTKHYIRTIINSTATGCDCIPQSHWPTQAANIYANYWEGDNSNYDSVTYFPLTYSGASGTASYNFVQYIAP